MIYKKRLETLGKIRNYVQDYKANCIFILIICLLLSGLSLVKIYLFKIFVDKALIERSIGIVYILSLYIAIFLASSVLEVMNTKAYIKLKNSITSKVREAIWGVLAHMHTSEYKQHSLGDMKLILDQDSAKISGFLQTHIIEYIVNLIQLIITCGIIFFISWKLALISLFVIPITTIIASKISYKMGEVWKKSRNVDGKFQTWISDVCQRWTEVKLLCQEDKQIDKFDVYAEEVCRLNSLRMFLYSIFRVVLLLKDEFFIKLLLYCCGGFLLIKNEITIGALLMFINVFNMLLRYMQMINENNTTIYSDMDQIDRTLAYINVKELYLSEESDQALQGNIAFNHVSFAYDQKQGNVINDLSFSIKAGTTNMISGDSGAGKSTIIKLLIGQYFCNSGDIVIDGYDIKEIANSDLSMDIGTVLQDAKFFNLSIRDNMRLVKEDVTDEELNYVFEKACLLEFLQSLPEEYDTLIGERGIKLSGGQRQRLAFARVILKDPNIIILDEVTSKLDGHTESVIYNTIREWGKKKTVILVTHRLSSVDNVDNVITI